MSEQSESILTDADREQWRLHVAGERAWLAKFPGFPLPHAILAVAVDNFLNVDLPVNDCAFCDYDEHSVTPFDGHTEDCPIRRLAEAAQ